VSLILAVEVSAVALADPVFLLQLDLVSLSLVVEVSAVALADSASWELQLALVSLSSFIVEVPTVSPAGRVHWFRQWESIIFIVINPGKFITLEQYWETGSRQAECFPSPSSDAVWRMSTPSTSRLWRSVFAHHSG
jgi:hypothetical protein